MPHPRHAVDLDQAVESGSVGGDIRIVGPLDDHVHAATRSPGQHVGPDERTRTGPPADDVVPPEVAARDASGHPAGIVERLAEREEPLDRFGDRLAEQVVDDVVHLGEPAHPTRRARPGSVGCDTHRWPRRMPGIRYCSGRWSSRCHSRYSASSPVSERADMDRMANRVSPDPIPSTSGASSDGRGDPVITSPECPSAPCHEALDPRIARWCTASP